MLTKIKSNTAALLQPLLKLDAQDIVGLLELPKKLEHGHLALPVFFLAKELKKAPPLIAKELSEKIEVARFPHVERVEPVGGFVNIHFDNEYLQKILFTAVFSEGDELGYVRRPDSAKVAIDFSSPNVAKPMHVGHLRATVIGQAIYNLAKTQGYEVLGINHLGDWGVQFGKLAWAYEKWGSEFDFKSEPFKSLCAIYVRYHEESENHPEYDALGSATFKKLEDGDPEIHKLWEQFVEISMKDYERLWQMLGVKHDLLRGESFFNDRMKPVEESLAAKGLLEESEGAQVVKLDEFDMPPCLIRKSDGASLYATRDLACAIYRMEELKCDTNLYVVGQDQTLHFKQVFKVLEKMGYEWASQCHHVAFGLYRFKDMGRMSSRKGNVVAFEDLLNNAIDEVRKVIEEKNPDLEDKEKVARQVGVGAITFNDLINDRVKNVDFDWKKALAFDGDSGPYVQYCVVRCKSIKSKFGQEVSEMAPLVLQEKEERELVRTLLNYPDVLASAYKSFRPHILATYLLEVCRSFSHFYHQCKVIGVEEDLERSRVTLVHATQRVLENGLRILNIESPDFM